MGQRSIIKFESGVTVDGVLKSTQRTRRHELCLLSFEDCTVKFRDKVLFQPEWGTFDMAVGSKVESVFSGPADRKAYGLTDSFAKKTVPKRILSDEESKLNQIYQTIRTLRSEGCNDEKINSIFSQLESEFKNDWLARLELIELCFKNNLDESLREKITLSLHKIKTADNTKTTVIDDGLSIAAAHVLVE